MSNKDCPATNNRGEQCGLDAGWGVPDVETGSEEAGPCKFHGGLSTGPSPEAAAGNQNAMKTGVNSDPVNLFEYLKDEDPEAAVWILSKLRDYAKTVDFEVFVVDVRDLEDDEFDTLEANMTARGDDLMQMCVRDYARWRAARRQLEEGLITAQTKATEAGAVEVEDSNPINLDLDRLDRTTMRLKKNNGLLDGPESQKADALEDGLELTLSPGDKDTLEDAFDTQP